MNVNLTQGIIIPKNKTNYLVRANGNINLVVRDTIRVIFAHGPANYLIEESSNVNTAWSGPFSDTKSYWFYWDISTETGQLSYGITEVEPSFGTTLPGSPIVDQHFFDKSDNYMKVWNGGKWIQKIRVFSGSLINGRLLGYGNSSQVDLYGNYNAEKIAVFDAKQVGRREVDYENFEFLTEEDTGLLSNFLVGKLDLSATVGENIPAYSPITLNDNGEWIRFQSSNVSKEAIGLSSSSWLAGEKRTMISKGFVTNRVSWKWRSLPNTPLFVDSSGNLTVQPPSSGVIQKIGHVVSPTTIFVNIQRGVQIDITPTPSVTLSPPVTPTPTPSG